MMSTEVTEGTGFQVLRVGPISFSVTVSAMSVQEVTRWRYDLMRRHQCVEDAYVRSGFHAPGVTGIVNEIKITLDEDADCQQICALRAELKI